MSFKRDGDDADLLRKLQFRRVTDLLADHIPDDEATLLSNGRLTCLICSHRPVLDSLTVLAMHRKGKRHISELSKFLGRQRELELRKLKADQQKSLATSAVQQQPSREKCKFGHRKPVLEMPRATAGKPGVEQPSSSALVRHYVKSLWRKRALEKTVERCRENYGDRSTSQLTGLQTVPEVSSKGSATDTIQASRLTPALSEPSTVPGICSTDLPNIILTSLPTVTKTPNDTTTRQKSEHEHHLRLKMSGWVQGADGSWTKDPNAEFDSDEDEPPGSM